MSIQESELRELEPKDSLYRKKIDDGLYLEIHPNGRKHFVWNYLFSLGTKLEERWHHLGSFGRLPGQLSLEEAKRKRNYLDSLTRGGDDISHADEKCPLCGSKDIKINSLKAFNENDLKGGNRYISTVEELAQLEKGQIFKLIKLRYCNNCESGWRANTSLDKMFNQLYTKGFSRHNVGTQRIINKLRDRGSYIETQHENLTTIVQDIVYNERRLGTNKLTYGEIGCPWQGLFSCSSDNNSLSKFIGNLRQSKRPKFLPLMLSIIELIESFIWKLALTFLRLEGDFKRIFSKRKQNNFRNSIKINEILSHFKDWYFIEELSVSGWSLGCNLGNNSCTQYLNSSDNINITTLSKLRLEGTQFTLIVCSNFIDHFDSPLEVIDEITKISKYVLISYHNKSGAGLQHKFALSKKFADVIHNKFKPLIDVTSSDDLDCQYKLLPCDYNFILIKRSE